MVLPSSKRFCAAAAIAIAGASAITACGGTTEPSQDACRNAVPPPVVSEARIIRIDRLDLGETRDVVKTQSGQTSSYRAVSYGYDLDGLCSDGRRAETVSCRRAPNAPSGAITDGDGGVDNSFGRNVLTYLITGYTKPSEVMSGFSYLETQRDGRGVLYLGTPDGVKFVIPLIGVRLTPATNGDTLGTLAAIAPRDAAVASIRARINLAYGPAFCEGPPVDTLVESIVQAADIRVEGPPNAETPCDGISIGLRLSGSPVSAVPPVRAGCTAE